MSTSTRVPGAATTIPTTAEPNYHNNATGGEQNSWLRAQWFAVDAEERFKRVMGDAEAASSPLTAQVRLGGGLADMLLGMTACESVGAPTGELMTDMQMLAQAERKLTDAMSTAQSAGRPEYAMTAQAGRAQARMLQGDWAGAVADAAAIPAGFSYDAIFNVQSTNSIVQLTTKNNNEAAGLMYKWWPMIDKSDEPGIHERSLERDARHAYSRVLRRRNRDRQRDAPSQPVEVRGRHGRHPDAALGWHAADHCRSNGTERRLCWRHGDPERVAGGPWACLGMQCRATPKRWARLSCGSASPNISWRVSA